MVCLLNHTCMVMLIHVRMCKQHRSKGSINSYIYVVKFDTYNQKSPSKILHHMVILLKCFFLLLLAQVTYNQVRIPIANQLPGQLTSFHRSL